MGSPIRFLFRFVRPILVLCLVLCLLPAGGFGGERARPAQLPPGDWDHLIITDTSLARAFRPLANHRRFQGLRSRVVTLEQAARWAGTDDAVEAVREVVAAAAETWDTRYVLLGGDAERIPVPLGYFDNGYFEWEIPVDLYYASPYGEWDADGDGWLAEWEQDAPDLTPVVALGRAPVADAAEASAFVAKVIAFETAAEPEVRDVLLAAEVGLPYPWSAGMEIHFDMAADTDRIAGILADWDTVGGFRRLYQSGEVTGVGEPLSPGTFLEALQADRSRFLVVFAHGAADRWSLGGPLLYVEDLAVLATADQAVFAMPLVPGAADCRAECMMETMLALPDGGCAGALAPAAMFYLSPGRRFVDGFWQAAAGGEAGRVGDAYVQTLLGQLEIFEQSASGRATAMCLSIVGDPALLFEPEPNREPGPKTRAEPDLAARAYPNPFNPATEISFVVPEAAAGGAPTTVEVFDLAGRRIARLVDGPLWAGPQSVYWQGKNDAGRSVGSGLYFARIRSGDLRSAVKLLLVE